MSSRNYEERMLALPIAGKVSGEDVEHTPSDPDYRPIPDSGQVRGHDLCGCDRCRIIRIKKRKAFRFSRSKCPACLRLITSLFTECFYCREINTSDDEMTPLDIIRDAYKRAGICFIERQINGVWFLSRASPKAAANPDSVSDYELTHGEFMEFNEDGSIGSY